MIDCVARIRSSRFPDPDRVIRCREHPEQGPRLFFFSGGTALREFSRRIVSYTHQSIHLVTPFDSGGSSARLREAFDMPAVGDLRNRLLALADESVPGVSALHTILSQRLDSGTSPEVRLSQLRKLVSGEDERLGSVSPGQRQTLGALLQVFLDRMPADFDLSNASVGNLVMAGGYLCHDRDIDSAIMLFSGLVSVRGIVTPVAREDLHLAGTLQDGSRVVGQHRLTGKEVPPIHSPIANLELVRSLENPEPATADVPGEVLELISGADLICFPMGSFYTSVLAQLLARGVGRAIALADCPKVYVANTDQDSEQLGMTLADSVEQILATARRDAGEQTPADRILNLVMIDSDAENQPLPVDLARLREMGVEVAEVPLVGAQSYPQVDPERLCEILVSLT